MQVLKQRKVLATRAELMQGTFYESKAQGFMSLVVTGLMSRLWSKPEEAQPSEYICVEFLDRQADQLLKWAAKCEKAIHSEQSLKRQLRKATQHSEADIELLLVHLKRTNRMVFHVI